MKKSFLYTTAIVALYAGSALAETPKVTLGGVITTTAGWVSEDLDAGRRNHAFQSDAEVHVTVDGMSDSGLGYGAVIELEADVSADADGEGLNADKTYIYLQGSWGRFELGSNIDAGYAMQVDASTLAAAGGGIANRFRQFGVVPSGVAFISHPKLPTKHGGPVLSAAGPDAYADANKITYYTPQFSGFQLGVSYTPDQSEVGQTVGRLDTDGLYEDVFNIGLHYEGQFDQVGLKAGIAGETADSELASVEDLAAWNIGLNLSYMDFTFGGSYGDWDESFQATGTSADSDYWTIGAAYDYGQGAVSVTYMDSDFASTSDFDNLAFSVDYHLAPGLTPFAELSLFDFDTTGTASDNEGSILLVGTSLSF